MIMAESLEGYKRVRKQDLVVNTMWAWMGAAGVTPLDGIVSPSYATYRFNQSIMLPSYFDYLVRTPLYISDMTRYSKGVWTSRLRLYPEDFLRLRTYVPLVWEQRVICDFLDTEITRIDALISKKRRLAELFLARTKILVDDAVEGQGRLLALRRVTSRITSGPRGWAQRATDSGSLFLRITNIQRNEIELDLRKAMFVHAPHSAESDRTRVRLGDVLVSITADIGSVGIARAEQAGAYVSQHIALVTPVGCEPEWLAYALQGSTAQSWLDSTRYGGTKVQLALEDVAETPIWLPPRAEQKQILDVLRRRLEHAHQTRLLVQRQIDLLQEHRQALITAVVTGEMEVPAARAGGRRVGD